MTLPKAWAVTQLGAVSRVEMGQSPDSATYNTNQVGLPFFQGKSEFGKLHPQVRKWCAAPVKVAEVGDILLSIRAPVGPTNIANETCAIGRGLAAIRPLSGISGSYLLNVLRHLEPKLAEQATGTTFPAVGGQVVRGLEIPLAPEDEQKRIATKLDTVLACVDSANARLADIAPILKRFRQSVLLSATNGSLTEDWRSKQASASDAQSLLDILRSDRAENSGWERGNASEPTLEAHDLGEETLPDVWRIATLQECCTPGRPITYGILKPGPELKDGIPYVRVADFPGNRLVLAGIKKTSPEIDNQYKRSRLIAGDLLLSIRGSVGRLIQIPVELEGANITQDTARLSISRRLSDRYIYWALLAPDMVARMNKAIRGVAVRGINIGDVRALQIPLPTYEEQTEIVRRVETLFAFADRLEARLQTAQTAVDRLTPSLLAKAFRGELVPQDPNDEPAAELLKRLRAASSDVTTKPARKRRTA